jgi:hypothetical protein
MICEELELLFINIARNASQSIRAAFKQAYKDYKFTNRHNSIRDICAPLPEGVMGIYKSFSISRNPYDRVVSMWLFGRKWHTTFKQFLKNIEDGEYKSKPGVYSRQSGLCMNWMNYPQTNWITDDSGKIRVDKIIRFENLQEDMDKLCDEWELKRLNIPKINTSEVRTGKRRMKWTRYYDNESLLIAGKLFKKDFETFGYELEI